MKINLIDILIIIDREFINKQKSMAPTEVEASRHNALGTILLAAGQHTHSANSQCQPLICKHSSQHTCVGCICASARTFLSFKLSS